MKIKVGIIGCGAITEFRHAPEYRMNKNVEIIAFCDAQLKRAEKLANEYGGKVFSDYQDIFKMKDLDAVSVCTSNNSHANITIEALRAGKHVLCEKPMATSIEDARAMIENAEKYGKFLMIGHNQRLDQVHVKAKHILDSGELGRILSFKTCFGHAGPEMWSTDKGTHTWFFKKNSASVGALGDLGIHKADLIRFLISDEIDEVCAMTLTADKRDEHGEWIGVEDNAACILKSKKGIVGNLNASWTYYGEQDNSTILYCEKGMMRILEHPEYQIIIEKKDGERIYYKTGNSAIDRSQISSRIIDAFVQSIISGIKPEISGEVGLEALSIILACMESHERKAFVKVKHFFQHGEI